jgi:sucrose-6F-phosphate phosphohydrolase
MQRLLLCCDLDRTVLPNGKARESAGVRDLFERLIREAGLILTYVSGRNLALLQQAMHDYRIPRPHYAIGDVGTTMYQTTETEWRELDAWSAHIGEDWRELAASAIADFLSEISELRLQEPEKQNLHKLSYYIDLQVSETTITARIRALLEAQRIRANIIYSVDEMADVGLIDILPQRASKYHAIEYLCEYLDIDKENTLFAGDSGNDLPVLISDIPSVLVNNAQAQVKHLARQLADKQGFAQQLYLARGGFYGLNGNYSAGILEGLAHFHTELRPIIAALIKDSA